MSPRSVLSLILIQSFTSVAREESFTTKPRLCTEPFAFELFVHGYFINFTAFAIDSCKAWKIYNFKIRLDKVNILSTEMSKQH